MANLDREICINSINGLQVTYFTLYAYDLKLSQVVYTHCDSSLCM